MKRRSQGGGCCACAGRRGSKEASDQCGWGLLLPLHRNLLLLRAEVLERRRWWLRVCWAEREQRGESDRCEPGITAAAAQKSFASAEKMLVVESIEGGFRGWESSPFYGEDKD